MADAKGKGKKLESEPNNKSPSKDAKAPKIDASKGDPKGQKLDGAKADPKSASKAAAPAASAAAAAVKVEPTAGKAVKTDPKATQGTADGKLSKSAPPKDEKEAGKRKTVQALQAAPEEAPMIQEFVPDPDKVYMYDADGKVMMGEDGNPYPGLNMFDIVGDKILDKKGNPIPGRFQFNEDGNIFLDAEGYPFLERQETTEEKQARLALEEQRRKAKAFSEKLEAQRVMMSTPLPRKSVKWDKFCDTMYSPSRLRTVLLKDRGRPGDDWRNFVKTYTIDQMNHRMARQLHGRALRIFRLEDTPKGKDYVLLDPPVAYFDGFEPGKTYVQHLRIFNLSPWSQRIRVIKPGTLQYSITSSENPFQGKTLVSGDKCDFDVIYQPPTVWCYEDQVEVKTEMDHVTIPLLAINPLPVVVLPTFVDMGLCLAGHAISYSYTLTSKGAGANFHWLPLTNVMDSDVVNSCVQPDPRYDDLESYYDNNNIFYIPPFVLYPYSFTTTTDSKQEFIMLFRPRHSGTFYTYVRLMTGTNLHWEIKFKATAIDLRLNLQRFEGMEFRPGQRELGIAFGQVTVSHMVSKEVTVKSHTRLPVRFFWRMQSKHLKVNEETDPECLTMGRDIPIENLLVFVADPGFGVFAVESESPIRFKFTPSDLANYHQVATLYVDTRAPMPLGSDVWKDFREGLRNAEYIKANHYAEQNWPYRVLWGIDNSAFECSGQILNQHDMNTVSSCIENIFHVSQVENGGTIFRMIEIDLAGSGTHFNVRFAPSLLQFSGILTLGQIRIEEIEMINESPVEVIFTWEVHKTPYGVVKNSAYVFPVTGKIAGNSSRKIQVTMKANKVGRIELVFHCLVESPYHKGKLPLVLKVEGHVSGPNVIITPCVVDFGLCQRDSTYTLEIVITNKSADSPATFKIFSTPDSQVPRSDPSEEDSQINPQSPNSKIPVGCTIFDQAQKAPISSVPPSDPIQSAVPQPLQQTPLTAQSVPESIPPDTIQKLPSVTFSQPSSTSPPEAQPLLPSEEEEELTKKPVCPFRKPPPEGPKKWPKDREVSADMLTEPQERAWISSAFGECLQVFNDGITDPKLPPTKLLQQRDTDCPKSTLPPLKTGRLPPGVLTSSILKGITALGDQKIIPGLQAAAGHALQPAKASISMPTTDLHGSLKAHAPTHSTAVSFAQPLATSEIPTLAAADPNSRPDQTGSSTTRPFVDTSLHLASAEMTPGIVHGDDDKRKDPSPGAPAVKKPFLEQMGNLGARAKVYGPGGPPIVRAGKDYASYEEDLLQTLIFEPSEGQIPKGGNNSVRVKVTLTGTICGFMRLAIVCEISGGLSPTQYAVARAHIDSPEACLIPCFVDLRTKFINIPIDLDIVIRNMKALPACYNWPPRDRVGCEPEDLDVEVRPQRGEIPPRLEWQLKFKLIPRKLGPLDTVLICNVFKMICPLGLQLKAIIVDVRISYYVFRPDREDGHQKRGRKVAHERILLKRQQDALGNPVEEEDPDNWVDPPVPCLDFGRRRELGRAHCLKLVARNHSPIETTINLSIGHYHSEPLASLVRDETWVISSLTERLSYLIPNRRDPFQSAMKNKARQHPPLTDLSDTHLKYFSQPGKQMLWRRAEGAMHEALIKEGHTVAFLCYPAYSGILKPWGDWSCEVVCFSNLPGDYIDILTSKVGRLKPVEIPLEIQIVGTPLVARRNWLEPTGLQQPPNEGEIVVAWQPTPHGCNTEEKQIWVYNQCPFHIELRWELKRQRSLEGKLVTMQFVIEEDVLTHALLTEKQAWDEEDPTVHVTTKEHIGIVYDQQVHVVFRDYLRNLEDSDDNAFSIYPPTQPESESFTTPFEDFFPKSTKFSPENNFSNLKVILGHSSMPFKISFTPNEEGLYSYIYAAYCRLFDGRTCERRRSTQFAFDKISDRPDEQYTFRRPEKKHVCEHVLTFHSKKDDKFVHTLVHKTSIVDPADPEILALNFNEDGTKPRRLSRYHCSEASNSGSEEDGFRPPKKSLTKKELSRARINAYLQNVEDGSSDLSAQDAWPSGGGTSARTERAYSKVHDVAYESEEEGDEPKFQFDMQRRSTRQRRVSTGRSVNFDMDDFEPQDEQDEIYDRAYNEWMKKPDVFLDEVMATKHAKKFFNFEAIRPLRVSLEAIVLKPRLKTNFDDMLHERLSFRCFGNDPPELRSDTQALYLTNEYPHPIRFTMLEIPEPFVIMNTRKGVVKPVGSQKSVQRMSIFDGDGPTYELESGRTLQFNITFQPAVDECKLNPPDVIFDVHIRLYFTDRHDQLLPLHGELLFPEVRLMQDKVCLGDVVNGTDTQVMDFSLANPCLPDADWRIVTDKFHLETVELAARGIPPRWEDAQGLDKVWPIIWSANPERGRIRGRRDLELTESLGIQFHWNRQIVTISFAPFDIGFYSQVIYVQIRLGRGVRLTLEGTGVDERPPTPPPPPPPPPEEPKEKTKKGGKEVKKPGKEAKKPKK
ncbi:hypothetical protein AXG93_4079s1260 [Marchantia polymorpha subsp. ruderalis]|uniref:Uncharacterized protein n=1 Tax=Marchantia polymorpha subsp. ruderalis TaxID=1480154 RepID=A0A176VVY5_MARPO|nr:hypothetical protein AXG93_4079s1260 [Marchantia polymorpha subsp. ruderalis]